MKINSNNIIYMSLPALRGKLYNCAPLICPLSLVEYNKLKAQILRDKIILQPLVIVEFKLVGANEYVEEHYSHTLLDGWARYNILRESEQLFFRGTSPENLPVNIDKVPVIVLPSMTEATQIEYLKFHNKGRIQLTKTERKELKIKK